MSISKTTSALGPGSRHDVHEPWPSRCLSTKGLRARPHDVAPIADSEAQVILPPRPHHHLVGLVVARVQDCGGCVARVKAAVLSARSTGESCSVERGRSGIHRTLMDCRTWANCCTAPIRRLTGVNHRDEQDRSRGRSAHPRLSSQLAEVVRGLGSWVRVSPGRSGPHLADGAGHTVDKQAEVTRPLHSLTSSKGFWPAGSGRRKGMPPAQTSIARDGPDATQAPLRGLLCTRSEPAVSNCNSS